jgi:hypothetical protein
MVDPKDKKEEVDQQAAGDDANADKVNKEASEKAAGEETDDAADGE